MILVDSSVWIDYFADRETPSVERLDWLLGRGAIATADLVLMEVLQGFRSDTAFARARTALDSFPLITISDPEVALAAARLYRRLRAMGVTPRKTIDTLIATRCVVDGHSLLFSDRDYIPFVEHCGLIDALAA